MMSCGICQSVGVRLRKGEHFPFWAKMVRTKIKPGITVHFFTGNKGKLLQKSIFFFSQVRRVNLFICEKICVFSKFFFSLMYLAVVWPVCELRNNVQCFMTLLCCKSYCQRKLPPLNFAVIGVYSHFLGLWTA